MMEDKKQVKGIRLIFGYLGIFLILAGIIDLLPLAMLIFYPSEANSWLSFFAPGVGSILIGLALFFSFLWNKQREKLEKFEDSILLVMIWIFAILVGSVPFMLRGLLSYDIYGNYIFDTYRMSFTDAMFEATSGYSTTGLTVFNFDASYPGYHLYTFFRSILLLFGGVGLVLIVSSALSDRYGLKLYTAEGHNDRLVPNMAKSARIILLIYLGYILVGTFSYWLIGGMEFFDAFNHSISAVSTGGFSTKVGGIYEILTSTKKNSITGMSINPLAINITSVLLMVLGGTNFMIHLFMFKGKFKKIFRESEMRFFLGIVILLIPLFFTAIYTSLSQSLSVMDSLGEGTYLVFSCLTTAGLNISQDINVLGEATLILCVVAMTIGGGMGSTSGGIKQYRFVIAFKSMYWSLRDRTTSKRQYNPHPIYRLGQIKEVDQKEISEAYGYMILYISVLVTGGLILTILGMNEYSASDCLFEFSSALSSGGITTGLLAGKGLPDGNVIAIKWILSCGMFAGRLEIACIYYAFMGIGRKIVHKR